MREKSQAVRVPRNIRAGQLYPPGLILSFHPGFSTLGPIFFDQALARVTCSYTSGSGDCRVPDITLKFEHAAVKMPSAFQHSRKIISSCPHMTLKPRRIIGAFADIQMNLGWEELCLSASSPQTPLLINAGPGYHRYTPN